MFNVDDCIIPQLWCGNAPDPPQVRGKRYTRSGTKYECMRKGFGAGMYTERDKHLPANSLQHIKYVGPTYEANFENIMQVSNLDELVRKINNIPRLNKITLLNAVLHRNRRGIDKRAFNSVILYLHNQGVGNLPPCSRIL